MITLFLCQSYTIVITVVFYLVLLPISLIMTSFFFYTPNVDGLPDEFLNSQVKKKMLLEFDSSYNKLINYFEKTLISL